MSLPFRYALLWIAGALIMVVSSMTTLQGSYADGVYGPAHADAFYHARRVLDVVMTGQPVLQFDDRIHVPEGSWITWPWAFDSALAQVTRLFGPFADENAANRVLMRIPIFLGILQISFVMLLGRMLRLGILRTAVLVMGAALLPSVHMAYAIGDIDHHGAEALWTTMTLCAGIWFFGARGRLLPAVLLGIVLGTALGVHNSLFILQLPVIGLVLLRWLRNEELPSRREIMAFAVSLLLTTLLICAPSQPWQRGFFEFYTLSWFHAYIAACTAVFALLLAYLARSPRNTVIVCALALLATVPIIGAMDLATKFVTGSLDSIQGVVEVKSPYQLYASYGTAFSTALYSWLMWLAAPLVLLNVWLLAKLRDAGLQFFAMMAAIGLLLLQLQFRFHMFGEVALLATPLLASRLAAAHWPAAASRIAAGVLAAIAVAFIPTLQHWTIHWRLANYAGYSEIRGVFPVLRQACHQQPGVVLAGIDAGHWIRYHSDCSVIGDAFLLTPLHAAKAHETLALLSETPDQVLDSKLGIRYVFVHYAVDVDPGLPEPNLEGLRARMRPLEARLLGPLAGLPPQYQLIWETVTPNGKQVLGRLFRITP